MAGVTFCGQCGERAVEGEHFCVACGAALRRHDPQFDEVATRPNARAPGNHMREGVALLARREHAAAAEMLERACEAEPGDAVAHAYLGIALLRMTRVADARVELEEAVRLAPESFICRSKYGEFLARLGFYDQALAQLDVALEQSPPDAESRHAALELRQFCKDNAKGLNYRQLAYPRLRIGSIVRRRSAPQPATAQLGRG